MTPRPVRVPLAALVLLAVSACASTSGRPQRSCVGDVELVVRNSTGTSVDLYRPGGSTPTFLATVPAGTTHLPLSAEQRAPSYLARRSGDQNYFWVGRNPSSRVQIEERCRNNPGV